MKAPIGLYITSYETSGDEAKPILSHIFWGKTLKEVYQYAHSHLISDAFFNGTFMGQLPWNDEVLILSYDGQYLTTNNNKHQIKATLKKLMKDAKEIHNLPTHKKLIQTVQHLSTELNDQ